MIGQVDEKGEIVKYYSKVSDCSVLKNISVITEREQQKKTWGVKLMSLHLDTLSLKVFGRLFETALMVHNL